MEFLKEISYGAELLAAECIFLYAFPKRRAFVLKLFAAFVLTLSVNYLFRHFLGSVFRNPFLNFVSLLLTVLVSFFGMWFAFRAEALPVLSSCMAGVAVQHIAYHIFRLEQQLPVQPPIEGLFIEWIVSVLVYLVLWLILGRWVAKHRFYEDNDKRMIAVAILIVLICIGITRLLRLGGHVNTYMTICTALYAIVCCSLALFVEFYVHESVRAKSELIVLKRINEEERRHYELSRENAEQMNIKYHDLKHKLRYLEGRLPQEELDSMRKLIDSYERTYDTGLDVLDIVLNEKQAQCSAKSIALTVMGNGADLKFMQPMDVYSLFGNLMDNAIEAVKLLQPQEKRQISLVLDRKGEFVYISCMNYTGNDLVLAENGLPNTTKKQEVGYHGYGLRSIRAIAEKYHGGMDIQSRHGMFGLNIYLTRSGEPIETTENI
ncbi:MAG: GHKL domain-containing protein [Clostridia bacterium]|nr:GHKL domain-containing protein [Clostridia bacterium]